MKRFLNDVNYLLSDMPYEECPELWKQLARWKQQIFKPVDEVKPGTDLNDVVFPLPAPIKENPLVLRPWGSQFDWNNSFTDYISRSPVWSSGDC